MKLLQKCGRWQLMANKTCKTRPFLLLMSHWFQAVASVSFGELMCYNYLTRLSLSGGGQSQARPYVNKPDRAVGRLG